MILVGFVFCCVSLAFYGLWQRQSAQKARKESAQLQFNHGLLEEKLALMRHNFAQVKEELNRKNKALEEAKAIAKRRSKKELGAEEKLEGENADVLEIERMRSTLKAMEVQLKMQQSQAQQEQKEQEAHIAEKFKVQIGQLAGTLKEKETEIKNLQEKHSKLRNEKSMEGIQVEMESLSEEVAGEIARLYRKSKQYENMHGMLHGKFQLAQERFSELQRRYFAVCRELALVVDKNNPPPTPTQARLIAEDFIAQGEENKVS